jgi:4-hydroxy-2-oxoheptanedioate aldolase
MYKRFGLFIAGESRPAANGATAPVLSPVTAADVAGDALGLVPSARVPWLEPGVIMKAPEDGAYDIVCPMVNDARQVAEFVSYMRCPPLRGPTRVSIAARAIEWGFNMTTVSGDSRLLAAAVASVAKFRQLGGQISATPEKRAY